MSSPDTDQLKKMVADLDAAVPREGAQVHLSQHGGGPDESKVIANQRGYLRLGIEFLRAAFAAPSAKSSERLDTDLRYLLTEDSTVGFDWFERREDISAPVTTCRRASKLIAVVAVGVCLLGVILAIIGLGTVVAWLSR